jgi:hypothetical protein
VRLSYHELGDIPPICEDPWWKRVGEISVFALLIASVGLAGLWATWDFLVSLYQFILEESRKSELRQIVLRGGWLEAEISDEHLLLRPAERVEQQLGPLRARAILQAVLEEMGYKPIRSPSWPGALGIPVSHPATAKPTEEEALRIRDSFAELVLAALDVRRGYP